jgi:hypothetical protein
LAGKGAIWPAIVLAVELVREAGKEGISPAIALAVELVGEAGMSHEAAEIETPSAAAPRDITDRAHGPVAAAVHPA